MRLQPEHVKGMALRTMNAGGEWDVVRAWPARDLRRLRGAGYLGRRGGYAPDELAHDLRHVADWSADWEEVLEGWRVAVLQLIRQERSDRQRRRETRLAARCGFPSWYSYRAHVYGTTVHHHAVSQGWR